MGLEARARPNGGLGRSLPSRPPTPMLRLSLVAALLVPLAGCPAPAETDAGEPVPIDPDRPVAEATPEDLEAARERWEAAGLDAYAMTLRRVCFCPTPDYTGPFEVEVRGGELASVRLEGAAVDDERGMTVEALFDLVQDAYDRDAYRITVEYDERLGYPVSVDIDYDAQMADEEIGYAVSGLEAL